MLLSGGCSEDPSPIPSFVQIDTIIVDSTNYDSVGSFRGRVDFAFFYIDDNLQGVYKLPAKFPVIGEGVKNFKIYAGVYEFGNSSTAMRYNFYEPYIFTDTLAVGETLAVAPHVQYDSLLKVPHVQDFDAGAHMFGSDFTKTSQAGTYLSGYPGGLDGLCGYMGMNSGDTAGTIMTLESATPVFVPKNLGLGYFIELDYKCNCPFYLDIKTSQGSRSIIGFNKREVWNKVYVNITYAIDVTPGTDVKLIFRMLRDVNIADQEVLIDNIKIVYRV